MVFAAGEGAGRSGSFFFFSHDRKFIIKTMTNNELELFLDKLPAFGNHIKQNPNTLLAKIFGVFTVKTAQMREVHVMLMENTAQVSDPEMILGVFDLKGSMVDRKVKGNVKPTTTLKDENFVILSKMNKRQAKGGRSLVNLKRKDAKKILKSIRQDVAFMMSQDLMDYSLLIVIEKVKDERPPAIEGSVDTRYSVQAEREAARATVTQIAETLTQKDFTLFLKKKHSFKSGNRVYHIAIIDYLQEWNLNKKMERLIKTTLLFKDGKMLSAIEPYEYGMRFQHFMERILK